MHRHPTPVVHSVPIVQFGVDLVSGQGGTIQLVIGDSHEVSEGEERFEFAEGAVVTVSLTCPTIGLMSTIELPDDVAAALAAAAAERDMTADELAAEALAGQFGPTVVESVDALGAFIGSVETGDPDWASTDTALLRKAADSRRSA